MAVKNLTHRIKLLATPLDEAERNRSTVRNASFRRHPESYPPNQQLTTRPSVKCLHQARMIHQLIGPENHFGHAQIQYRVALASMMISKPCYTAQLRVLL